jgi:hypothetical protein
VVLNLICRRRDQWTTGERTMADHRALGRLGWAFGAITVAVLLTAAVVVTSQADQGPNIDATRFIAAAAPSSSTHDFANLFHR